jgi:hypothetical protein
LPSRGESLLLEAILLKGEREQAAWAEWSGLVKDPISLLRSEKNDRHRALLPILATAIEKGRLEVAGTLRTVAQTALLREERRHERSLEISGRAAAALERAGLDPLTVGGAPMAGRFWRHPGSRHSGGPRFVVVEERLTEAYKALGGVGFEPFRTVTATSPTAGGAFRMVDESGLSCVVSSRLVDLPMRPPLGRRLEQQAETWVHGGLRWRGPGIAHSLFEICAEACLISGMTSLLWVPDALEVVTRSPRIDWEEWRRCVDSSAIQLPFGELLSYLADRFGAAVPARVRTDAEGLRPPTARADLEAALAWSQASGRSSADALLRTAPSWQNRLRRALWIAAPSRRFLEEVYGARSIGAAIATYTARTFRWARRRMGLTGRA